MRASYRTLDLRWGTQEMKNRLIGVALLMPLVIAIVLAAPTCTRGRVTGGDSSGYGQLGNNLLAGFFIAGLVCAFTGVGYISGQLPKKKKED
jgi:hypothetical protein